MGEGGCMAVVAAVSKLGALKKLNGWEGCEALRKGRLGELRKLSEEGVEWALALAAAWAATLTAVDLRFLLLSFAYQFWPPHENGLVASTAQCVSV